MSGKHDTPRWPRARRWLKRGLCGLGIGLFALTALLLVALDQRPTREFARGRVNAVLSELFRGQILVDRIGSLRLDGIAGIDARLLDAQGRRVVTLRGLRVRSNWPELVRALVLGRPLNIVLEPLTIDQLDVLLVADSEGLPTLASAFEPRTKATPSPSPVDEPASVSIKIAQVRIRHLWAHGSLPSIPVIDAEFDEWRGSFEYGARGLAAQLASGRLRARALPAQVDPVGSLSASLELPAAKDAAFSGIAKFEGQLASAPATLTAKWKLPSVEAALLAPALEPAVLKTFLPNSKFEGPASLEAHVRGRLPTLDFDAKVLNQASEAQLKGQATFEAITQVACELNASNVDLAPILGDAPRTRLSLTASAGASIANGGAVRAEYRLLVPPGRFGANDTPALSTRGNLVRESEGALQIAGRLQVEEPGAPTRADYRVSLTPGGKSSLHAELSARLSKPPRLLRLTGLQLTGPLSGNADVDLASQQILAHVRAELAPVVHQSARAKSLDLTLKASGAMASPELELRADAREVSSAGRHFRKLKVTALGKPEQLRVTATADGDEQQLWRAEARLGLGQEILIDRPSLSFSDREGQVSAGARRVRVVGSQIHVDELELSGLGEVRATGSFSSRRVNAQFTIDDLDLGRVSRLSGLDFAKKGKLSLEGKVEGPLAALEGRIQGRARDLDLGTERAGEFDVDLDFAQRKINGRLTGKLGRSQLKAQLSDLDMPMAPFTQERLRALRGELSLEGTLDLRQLAPALRRAGIPVERARGQLQLDLQAANPRAGKGAGNPRLDVHVKSQGLMLVEQRVASGNIESPSQARQAQPLAVEGIDLDLRIVVDPAQERAEVHGSLFDRQGPLLAVDGEAKIPESFAANLPAKLDSWPLRVSVRAPERPMEKLPSAVRPSVMRGLASFELDGEGTVREPKLRAKLAVRRLQAREGRNSVDLRASAEYANTGGKLEGEASATRGGTASLRTAWTGNLIQQARSAGVGRPNEFELSTDLVIQKFPVAIVPALSDSQVRGPLSGEVHLRGLGKNAELEAVFDGSGISVNRVAMPALKVSLRADDKQLVAKLDATQSQGMARAEFSAPSAWGARMFPELESSAKLDLKARAFELEALSPVLMRYVSTIEGSLDADVSAQLDPKNPSIKGTATLKNGVFQIPELGQRFSDVQAKVSVRDNEIRVDALQARGITGRLTGEARAKLNGTALQSASARIEIKEKEKLPITLEGVVLGDAWGHATVSYVQTSEKAPTEIAIDVPDFRLQMPDAAQNSVQDLDPADDIRIGAHRVDGKFVAVPLEPLDAAASDEPGEAPNLTRVRIHLGNSVWIDRGRQASVQLTGDLQLESGAEQQVSGRIELRGGKLDVSGKQFEIERGVISFEGDDPSNPTVTATARWDSPAEYTVYAEYAGTVKTGKLKLRAEPALSQDEILSLILFGAPSGSMASDESNSTAGAGAAVSVAGGTATQGLNRAISDVTSLDVSTRIDTSTGSARPELVVQLTPRLTTRVTRAIGEPAPGQSPDRTFLTLELRLKRSWAISAVVGDHGASALDLIWRRRY